MGQVKWITALYNREADPHESRLLLALRNLKKPVDYTVSLFTITGAHE